MPFLTFSILHVLLSLELHLSASFNLFNKHICKHHFTTSSLSTYSCWTYLILYIYCQLLYDFLNFASFNMPRDRRSLAPPFPLKYPTFGGRPFLEESRKHNSDDNSGGEDSSHTFLHATHFIYYVSTYFILHNIIQSIIYFIIIFFLIGNWRLWRWNKSPKVI